MSRTCPRPFALIALFFALWLIRMAAYRYTDAGISDYVEKRLLSEGWRIAIWVAVPIAWLMWIERRRLATALFPISPLAPGRGGSWLPPRLSASLSFSVYLAALGPVFRRCQCCGACWRDAVDGRCRHLRGISVQGRVPVRAARPALVISFRERYYCGIFFSQPLARMALWRRGFRAEPSGNERPYAFLRPPVWRVRSPGRWPEGRDPGSFHQ